jgi:hypothetical protein
MSGMPERVTLWTTGGGFCMRPYGAGERGRVGFRTAGSGGESDIP